MLSTALPVGTRVSGTIFNQDFTGTVTSTSGRGGHFTAGGGVITPSVLETVHISTDHPLTTPAGRQVRGCRVDGDGLDRLVIVKGDDPEAWVWQ